MTSMPELVAAFHSLVGMAAVLVAAGAFYAPEAFDIARLVTPCAEPGRNVARRRHRALTFTGSVLAFLKLSARMSGAPIILPAPLHQHRARSGAGVFHRRPRDLR